MQTSLRLVDLFAEVVRQNGATPVVVMFPRRGTLERYRTGEPPVYDAGIRLLQDQGINVLDLAAGFTEAAAPGFDFGNWFAEGGHYNDAGNRVVSQAVIGYLTRQGIIGDKAQ